MLGPINMPGLPGNVMDSAVDNPARAIATITINVGVAAIQEAINPTPEQQAEKEKARKEEGEKQEKARVKQREAEDALQLATRLQAANLSEDKSLAPSIGKVEVLSRIGQIDPNTGPAFDALELDLSAQIESTKLALARDPESDHVDTAVDLYLPPGYELELSPEALRRAGVIRLSRDGDQMITLPDGALRVSVRLDFPDGSARTEMDLRRRADSDLARNDQPAIAGRIERDNKRVAA